MFCQYIMSQNRLCKGRSSGILLINLVVRAYIYKVVGIRLFPVDNPYVASYGKGPMGLHLSF